MQSNEPRLRLRVTTTAEWVLRSGHPWLFGYSILEQNRPGQLGELAVIYCWFFLYIAAAGPGAWALDNLRRRPRPVGIQHPAAASR